MSTTQTPTWNESNSIAAALLSRGNVSRVTIDLRAVFAARVFLRMGRTGTTPLTTGVNVNVRPMLATGSRQHPTNGTGASHFVSGKIAAAKSTVNADSSSSTRRIFLVSTVNFAVGDLVALSAISDSLTRFEIGRIANKDSSSIYLDSPLQYSHTAVEADQVLNLAEAFPVVNLEGGAEYEIIYDYSNSSSGDAIVIEAYTQVYTSNVEA